MIKVIIFDYGGTITKGSSEERGLYGICQKFSKVLKIPVNKVYPAYHKFWHDWKLGKTTINQVYSKFLANLNSDYPKDKLIYLTYHYSILNKNVVNLIKKLKKDYKIVCLSNHAKEWFENDARRFRLNKLFSKTFVSYKLGIDKPHPAAYHIVLKSLKVKPEECLFIDDLQRNTEVAKQLGMHVIHLKSYSQLKKEITKLGL